MWASLKGHKNSRVVPSITNVSTAPINVVVAVEVDAGMSVAT